MPQFMEFSPDSKRKTYYFCRPNQNCKLMILMSQHIPSDKRAEICLQYLRQIAVNNNREWFHEHRDLYDEARAASKAWYTT